MLQILRSKKLESPSPLLQTDTNSRTSENEQNVQTKPPLQSEIQNISEPHPLSSIAGNLEKEQTVKIYSSNVEANPSLAYVDIILTSVENKNDRDKGLALKALHDSGCAKTVVKTSAFQTLLKQGFIELKQPEKKVVLISCTGEAQPIQGSADIIIHFTGANKVKLAFELNVLVHSSLNQDFLLGRDFTGSEAKAFETNEHLYLTDQYNVYWDPIRTAALNQTLCQVPLMATKGSVLRVATCKTTVIPPFHLVKVRGHFNKHDNPVAGLPVNAAGQMSYEVKNSLVPYATACPFFMQFKRPNEVNIPIYNSTMEEIIIDAHEVFAEVELFSTSIEVNNLQVQTSMLEELECNLTRPDFIELDDAMNEEEKEDAFMSYLKRGYHHPSMTKEVEEKASLTEMYLKSTIPVPDSEFDAQFDLTHIPPRLRKYAIKIFRKNQAAFSKHACDLGKAKGIEMDIPLLTDKPHIQKYVPIPHAVRPQLRAVLDQMVEFGIIRICNEPSLFCSNLLVVKKKDGQSIRVLLDGRLLNHYMQRLPTNLVSQPELYAHLVQKVWVTTADLSDSFFQMMLKAECQALTAFYSEAHGQRYCFTRVPQGLKNSPLHLKLLMDTMFGDMAKDVIHYADDIMIATDGTLQDHLDKVGEVLKRLIKANIKIRPQKLCIAKDTVEFLGVVWQRNKISIPEAKTLAFRTLPTPKTPKIAKSVMCALAYYRKFIPHFADLVKPISDLYNLHPKQFKWTDEHEACFRKIIDLLCEHATLHLPDPKKPYYVQTDASEYCGSGRVFQKDEDGDEKLLTCISRTFTKTERAYSTVKKEVLALLYTMKSMDFFLHFAPKIIILVDAKAIIFLRLCRESTGILLRFSIELSRYDVEIHHVKGENNEIADVLSRQHIDLDKIIQETKSAKPMTEKQAVQLLDRLKIPEGTSFTPEEVSFMLDSPSLPSPDLKPKKKSVAKEGLRQLKNHPQTLHNRNVKMPKEVRHAPGAKLPANVKVNETSYQCNSTDMSYTDFKAVSRAILAGALTPEQFIQAQRADDYINHLIEKKKRLKRFILINGILFFQNKRNLKPVLPVSLLDIVINAKHFSVFGLHFSKTRMQRDILSKYHVQQSILTEKLKMLKQNCIICQFNATGEKDQQLRRTDYIYSPRTTWAIDLMPNMPLTPNGNKVALLAVDLFTGYIQICPMRNRKTETLIEAIRNTIIKPFGIPKFIRSDNEPGLARSKEFFAFLQPLGTKFFPTSIGSPWANGHAERSIRTIKEGAKKFLMQENLIDQWDTCDEFFTNAHNSSTSVYGYSPEELMFATKIPQASDLLRFWPTFESHSEYVEKIFPIAEKNRNEAQARADNKKDQNRSYKNQSRVDKKFELGQVVAHRQLQLATGPNMSMKPKFEGPYIIIALNNDKTSATLEHLDTGFQMKGHFTNMTPISFHPSANRLPTNFDDNTFPLSRDKYTLKSKSVRNLNINLDENEYENVQARFPTNGQNNKENWPDKLLSINVDEGTRPAENMDNFGKIINDDYEELQEQIRQELERQHLENESISDSDSDTDSFNEEDLLNDEERDEPVSSGSQLYRDYEDHLSESENEDYFSSYDSRERVSESILEEESQDSNPQPRGQSPTMSEGSDLSFDENVGRTYLYQSDSESENEVFFSSQKK